MDIYSFHYRFSIVVTPPEEGWIFNAFNADSQLWSPRLRRGGYLMISMQILNCGHVVTPPEEGWIFNAFNADSQLWSPRYRTDSKTLTFYR